MVKLTKVKQTLQIPRFTLKEIHTTSLFIHILVFHSFEKETSSIIQSKILSQTYLPEEIFSHGRRHFENSLVKKLQFVKRYETNAHTLAMAESMEKEEADSLDKIAEEDEDGSDDADMQSDNAGSSDDDNDDDDDEEANKKKLEELQKQVLFRLFDLCCLLFYVLTIFLQMSLKYNF